MKFLDLSLDDPAENLAVDEALLEEAEQSCETASLPAAARETLRIWESPSVAVVVGRSSQVGVEVQQAVCERLGVPVLRRTSGGAAVVIGPGCLMYSVVLSYEQRPELRMIERAHAFVLERVAAAVRSFAPDAELCGTSDLACRGRKFSGNSLRCKRSHLLYHGTLLYDFPLELIGQCLGVPPRQPDYREGRNHLDFVMNLRADPNALRTALIETWAANEPRTDWPRTTAHRLANDRYRQPDWNLRL